MKVLHIYGHDFGGAFVISQLKELHKRGYDLQVICPGEGPFAEKVRAMGIPLFIFRFQGSQLKDICRIVAAVFDMYKFMVREKPDVVHYHLIKAIIAGRLAAWFARVPLRVSQLGGTLSLEVPVFRYMDLTTSFIDHALLCSSEGIFKVYENCWITRGKSFLVYYGFPLEPFLNANISVNRNDARREFGISLTEKVVGMVAVMYDSNFKRFKDVGLKGHETLIRAAVRMLTVDPSVKFLIVGQDSDGGDKYFNRLKKMAERFGVARSIIFTGFRSDVHRLIAAMDVVAVPSLSENCGGAVEPLLLGVPVVASNVGGLPDVVLEGQTGWLVPPADPDRLAEALTEVLALPVEIRKLMGSRGRALVKKLFDISSNVDKLEVVYNRVHGNKRLPL